MLLCFKAIQAVSMPETIQIQDGEQNAGRLHFVQRIVKSVMKKNVVRH